MAQRGALEKTIKRMEVVGVSAMTLVEVGILLAENRLRTKIAIAEFFAVLENNPAFQLMPVSYGVAAEAGAFIALRDPADRVIAATARVHRMTLLTADERLAGSGLVNCLT